MTPERGAPFPLSPRLFLGVVAVVFGVVLVLERTGVLASGFLAGWWPAGLALLGLLQLVFGDNSVAKVVGLCLLLLGGTLVFANLYPERLSSDSTREAVLALVLVVVGIFLIVRSLAARRLRSESAPGEHLSVFAFWSGQERRVQGASLRGGDLTAVMGGFELDLRDADLAPGEHAQLDVLVIMGGGKVRVPEDWTVECSVTPVMGGVSVKSRTLPGAARKLLVVRGLALMGGIEIRN